MRFVNLTPHDVVIQLVTDGSRLTISTEGKEKAVRVESVPGDGISVMLGVPLYTQSSFGAVVGLPDEVMNDDGTHEVTYIVSMIAAQAIGSRNYRSDVYYPGTGPNDNVIRNEKGQIEAVTRLIRCY